MECAASMPLEKKLKPMVIPTLDSDKPVDGGYIPYSLPRADAFSPYTGVPKQESYRKNIWPTLESCLPLVGLSWLN